MRNYIFGAGAHGRVVADSLQSQSVDVTGFLDDDASLHGRVVAGLPILGGRNLLLDAPSPSENAVIVAVGNPVLRLELSRQFAACGCFLLTVVHRQAILSPSARVGQGTSICAGAVVNPDAEVGSGVIVNTGATIDHDCVIGDGVHLSPGVHLAGRVRIGQLTFLGTGVCVAPRVEIGANTVVGAGAAVVHDIPSGVLAFGVPARVIRELTDAFDWRQLL